VSAARHRVMIVGAGSIGERHLRCFLATGRAAVCFAELNRELRDAMAARYPQAAPFETPRVGSETFNPTAAVVATPAPLHVLLASELVERGVHVLIEKPLAVTEDGIAELTHAVRSRGVTASVAYVYRAHPVLASMRQAIAANEFGKPLELIVVAGQSFPTYRPAYRNTYYARHESGGGAVQDALTHLLDAGQWLVGRVNRVVADAARQKLDGVDVEDTVHVLARQGDTVLATYSLNQHQAPNELTITVVCDHGTVRFENHHGRWRSILKPDEPWRDRDEVKLERDTLFRLQADAFLDAVEGKAAPLCTLDEAIATLSATRAILQSIESRGWCSTALSGQAQ
jgi:predicted dehydrogenase